MTSPYKKTEQDRAVSKIIKALDEKLPDKKATLLTRDSGGVAIAQPRTVKLRYKKIVWGIPFDEVCFSKWVVNLLRLNMMPWDSIATTNSTYLPEARNTIHSAFLDTDVEYLAMLDSDVIPPPDFIDRLLAHHLPMVGGWYRKKGEPYNPVVYDFDHLNEKGIPRYAIRDEPGTGLEKVDAAGAGCWLIHRKVAEAIGKEPYDMEHGGEDLRMCERVRAAGFEIYIDWSISCAHTGVAIV